MSPGQTLRAFVTARLAAAAEDIFELFERTILEYEEELCRCKEKRRQEEAHGEERREEEARGEESREKKQEEAQGEERREKRRQEEAHGVQVASLNSGLGFMSPGLNTETPQIKEELEERSIKQEEEEQQEPAPDYQVVNQKTEEPSLLQKQTEYREETQGEEQQMHSPTERHTDKDENWRAPLLYPHSAENPGDTSGTAQGDEANTHQSAICTESLQRPHYCPFCDKTFVYGATFRNHMQMHTGVDNTEDKNHQCNVCRKTFKRRQNLKRHMRTHTGEKPFGCPVCLKRVCTNQSLVIHMRTHTGERPYGCSVCMKRFSTHTNLVVHMRTHTGKRSFSSQ